MTPMDFSSSELYQNDFWGRNAVCLISRRIILLLRQSRVYVSGRSRDGLKIKTEVGGIQVKKRSEEWHG